MRKISFIGCYDKIDLMLYVAKILVAMDKKVLVVDSTINQKAKYIVPVIKPTKAYVTEFEEIDVAVGFDTLEEIKEYLGISSNTELPYDMVLLDIDSYSGIENFGVNNEDINYFVTGFDLYTLKRGLEILGGLTKVLNLTKILFSRTASKEENDYLNYLSLGYKIEWSEEIIYFPLEMGDESVIAENQRVSKIKFKRLSTQYKEALIYIAEQILGQNEYSKMKKIFKQLERGV